MSQANVELARKAFEARSAGGVEAVLAFYPPDVLLYPTANWIEEPVYRGHDGVRRLDTTWVDNFDDWAWEVHEIREVGSRVVALVEMTGRIKGSGVPIRQPQGIVASDFRDGMIGEVRFFESWQQALEAVGLASA